MSVRDEVQVEMGDRSTAVALGAGVGHSDSFRLVQVVLFGLTIAGIVVGWRITVPGGIAPASSVAFGLTLAWALVGFVDTRARDRPGRKASPFHLLAAVDARGRGGALAAGRTGGDGARVGQRAGHRHAGRPGRDGDLVPLPPRTARRPVARPGPAGHGWWRLSRGRRRRARVRGGPPAVQPGRRSSQLGHRGGAGGRSDAQPLHRVDRLLPGANGMVRHRGDPRRHRGAGGDRPPPPRRVARATGRGDGGSDRARAARPAGRGKQEDGSAREPRPGPGARRVRILRGDLGHLPGGRARASVTHPRQPETKRSWLSPWSPPAWQPSSSYPCGPAFSTPPPGSSTDRAKPPTRCCAPSAAGSPAPFPWTSCCCSSPSRCARRWTWPAPRSTPGRVRCWSARRRFRTWARRRSSSRRGSAPS